MRPPAGAARRRKGALAAALGAVLAATFSGSAALADGAPSLAESGPSCAVDRHVGVTDDEAAAVEAIVCDVVRTEGPRGGGSYHVEVVRLGGKVVLTLSQGGGAQKKLVLTSLDEVTVAAPRLLEAAGEQKPVEETMTVTNVVGDEARTPKKRPSSVHAALGVLGAGAFGHSAGGGANLTVLAGSEQLAFVIDLRLAGESFNKPAGLAATIFSLGTVKIDTEASFSFVSLAAGARHHFTANDVSPFVGLGVGLDYIGFSRRAETGAPYGPTYQKSDKTGLAGYAELGLDLLRTHTVGGAIALRVDAPAFALEEVRTDPTDPSRRLHATRYAPVFGAGVAIRF